MKKVCFLSLFCDRLYCCRCILPKKRTMENTENTSQAMLLLAEAHRAWERMRPLRENASATRITPMATSGAT